MSKGGCLCGAVTFTTKEKLAKAISCHCQTCRTFTGSYAMLAPTSMANVEVSSSALTWYRRDGTTRDLGFCATCGTNLFDRRPERDMMLVFIGSLEAPTGLKVGYAACKDEAGDYYDA